ncbi:MAG: bile acid:sodium symporter [Hyphomicrobiales bacterium]|nr:bile acid:sodium symporter family protein [Hyphomicrobiales bacterium]PCH50115.1 MAG: bile acid:sodium symporter [Hyphomicrobiales bacterium]
MEFDFQTILDKLIAFDKATLLQVALPVSLGIIMFSLGLGLKFNDFLRVFRRPVAFSVGAINQLLMLPLVAFIIAIIFALPPELSVGLMILSLCPGGVTTNFITRLAKGDVALSVSLTAIISLVSILTVPLMVAFSVGLFMGKEPAVDVSELSIKIFTIVAVPVMLGMLVNTILRSLARPVERFFTIISTLLFILIIGAVLFSQWDLFTENLAILGPALIILNIILLFFGWTSARFIGLNADEATTIAIETGVQNGTLGIAVGAIIAGSAAGDLSAFALPSAVYSITMYMVTLPFIWFRRIART